MNKYTVNTAFKDADGIHAKGDEVTLADAVARELLALGAISPVAQAVELTRAQLILAAVKQLDPANDDVWLKDGKPDAAAIADITGWPVTAAERDAAWAEVTQSAQ